MIGKTIIERDIRGEGGPDRLTGSEVAHATDSSVISWRRGVGAVARYPWRARRRSGHLSRPPFLCFVNRKVDFGIARYRPRRPRVFRRNNVRLRLRPARRASSQLLNSDLITLFEECDTSRAIRLLNGLSKKLLSWRRNYVTGEEELKKTTNLFGENVENINKKKSNYSLKYRSQSLFQFCIPSFFEVASRNVFHSAIDFKNQIFVAIMRDYLRKPET